MGRLLRLGILIVSIATSAIIVGLAYLSNYDSILEKPNLYLILGLLFINIIANIFQIIEFLEKHLGRRKEKPERKLDEIFYKATKDLDVSYSSSSRVSEQEKPENQ